MRRSVTSRRIVMDRLAGPLLRMDLFNSLLGGSHVRSNHSPLRSQDAVQHRHSSSPESRSKMLNWPSVNSAASSKEPTEVTKADSSPDKCSSSPALSQNEGSLSASQNRRRPLCYRHLLAFVRRARAIPCGRDLHQQIRCTGGHVFRHQRTGIRHAVARRGREPITKTITAAASLSRS